MPSEDTVNCGAAHLPDDRLDLLGDLALWLLWSRLAAEQVPAVGRLSQPHHTDSDWSGAIAAGCHRQKVKYADELKICNHRLHIK